MQTPFKMSKGLDSWQYTEIKLVINDDYISLPKKLAS